MSRSCVNWKTGSMVDIDSVGDTPFPKIKLEVIKLPIQSILVDKFIIISSST